MPFTEEDKVLINNLLDLKGHNNKHLREFPSFPKAMGYWVGQPLF